MTKASKVVFGVLAVVLSVAAVLKGWQLLTEPVANNDIWSYRPFVISQVELELALAIWLLSGLFRKAAWLAAISCFSLFSVVTLYKALTGAASCGCFGSVPVNPWITLFAIDLPAAIALLISRPKLPFSPRLSSLLMGGWRFVVKAVILEFATPLPSVPRFAATTCIGLITLGVIL